MAKPSPIEIFFSYAHEDEALRDELTKHLAALRRQGVIKQWHDREIIAGTEWSGAIDKHLNEAQIILLLISPDFMASDYCFDVEVKRALERHRTGEARVVPVILRPVDWGGAPFSKLQALPKDAEPVTSWPNHDQALADVAKGIRKVIREMVGEDTVPLVSTAADTVIWELVVTETIQGLEEQHTKAILARLRDLTGDALLTLVRIESGSVRLLLDGTLEGFERIENLFKNGQLRKIEGFTITSIHVYPDQDAATTTQATTSPQLPGSVHQESSVVSNNSPTVTDQRPASDSPAATLSDLSPLKILKEAIRAVPAVKYALGVAGIAAAVAIIAGFKIDYRVAVLGTIIMFVLMFVLVIFSSFARTAATATKPLALSLAWSFVLLTIATSAFIFTGFFFSWPRPLGETAEGISKSLIGTKPSPNSTPPSLTPTASNALRLLNYSVTVCKARVDPQCQQPFPLAGEINFERDYKIRVMTSSPQSGYLYIVNEGPSLQNNLPQYVLIFPSSRMNGGSARLNDGKLITIPNDGWLRFDEEEGKEKLWLIWSAQSVGVLEDVARNVMLNIQNKGAITENAAIMAVKDFLEKHPPSQPEVVRNEEINQTTIKTTGDVLVFPIKLEHH